MSFGTLMCVGAAIEAVLVLRLRSLILARLMKWIGLPILALDMLAQTGLLDADAAGALSVIEDMLTPLWLGCFLAGFVVRPLARA